MRRHFGGDVGELRGLVAEHDEIGALSDLGVARQRLAAELCGERLGARGDGIGAQHGPPPSPRQRARHVACSDETYLHSWLSVSRARAGALLSAESQASQGRSERGVRMSTRASEDAARRRLSVLRIG